MCFSVFLCRRLAGEHSEFSYFAIVYLRGYFTLLAMFFALLFLCRIVNYGLRQFTVRVAEKSPGKVCLKSCLATSQLSAASSQFS